MASNILNVLNEIEKGRKECVIKAKSKNYPIKDNASFRDISDVFNSVPTTTGEIVDIGKTVDITNIKERIYDNKVKLPEIYNTLLNTFKEQSVDTDYYYPVGMYVLDNTETETIFVTKANSTSTSVPSANNTVELGTTKESYYVTNYIDYKIITSDGTTYYFEHSTNNNITHTWDTTKDINNLRYFVLFQKLNSTTLDPSTSITTLIGSSTIGAVNIRPQKLKLRAVFFNLMFSIPVVFQYNSTNYKDTLEYIVFTDLPNAEYEKIKEYIIANNKNISMGSHIYYGGVYATNLKKIIVDSDIYTSLPSTSTSNPTINIDYIVTKKSQHPSVKTNLYVSSLTPSSTKFNSYVEDISEPGSSYSVYARSKNGIYIYTSSSNPHRGALNSSDTIKNISDAFPNTDILGSEVNTSNTVVNAYLLGSSNIEIPDTVTRLGAFGLYMAGANQYLLNLDNIKTIVQTDSLTDCYASIIKLNSVESLSYKLFGNIHCRELQLNGLKTITAQLGDNMMGATKLSMEQLEEYNYVFPTSQTLEIINAPKLKRTILKPFTFTDYGCEWTHLHTLILGEDFETSIDLSSCIGLSLDSVLDLINKLKDYSDVPNQHSLKLPQYQYLSLSEEELSIATNKGWNVTSEGRKY